MATATEILGTVYLLHFTEPYRHARHYLGWTRDLTARLAAHRAGAGARLLAVIQAAGIGWTLARTWPGTRSRERALKRQGGSARRCPLCGVRPRPGQPPAVERAEPVPPVDAGRRRTAGPLPTDARTLAELAAAYRPGETRLPLATLAARAPALPGARAGWETGVTAAVLRRNGIPAGPVRLADIRTALETT